MHRSSVRIFFHCPLQQLQGVIFLSEAPVKIGQIDIGGYKIWSQFDGRTIGSNSWQPFTLSGIEIAQTGLGLGTLGIRQLSIDILFAGICKYSALLLWQIADRHRS